MLWRPGRDTIASEFPSVLPVQPNVRMKVVGVRVCHDMSSTLIYLFIYFDLVEAIQP